MADPAFERALKCEPVVVEDMMHVIIEYEFQLEMNQRKQ